MTTKELILSHNNNTLAGTLVLPESGYAERTILFLHSSERSHRDDDYFPELAEYAASQGIASFRYDSPGSGSSTGNAYLQSMQERSDETKSWFKLLQQQKELNPAGIGISGLSEGAVIAFMADIKEAAFLAPVSFDAYPFHAERFLSEARAELIDEGHSDERIAQEILQMSYAFSWLGIATGDGALDTDSVEPDHSGCRPLYELAAGQSEDVEERVIRKVISVNREKHGDWKYFDYILNDMDGLANAKEIRRNKVLWNEFSSVEPATYAETCSVPVLASYGAADPYFEVEKSIQLFEMKSNWCIKRYEGMGHSIDSDDGFSKDFMKDLCDWILQ